MGQLTTVRLLALVAALVEEQGRPAGARRIVAAARSTTWGEDYRYQRVYTDLMRLVSRGLLVRSTEVNAVRRRGMRCVSYVWSPAYWEARDADATAEPMAVDPLVDATIARLVVGTVLIPHWVVFKLQRIRPGTTTDEVTAALERRGAEQRPMLVRCTPESGWGGWWRVAEADAMRGSRATRTASDALMRRVRAAQDATGRSGIEVRSITAGATRAVRAMLTARVVVACSPESSHRRNTRLVCLAYQSI